MLSQMKILDFVEGTLVKCTEDVLAYPKDTQFNVKRVFIAHNSKRIKGPGAKGWHRFPGSVLLSPVGDAASDPFKGGQRKPSLDLIENPEGEEFPFEIVNRT